MEKIAYGGWPNCIRLSNGLIELIATTDVGPRIIRFGYCGGLNVFKEFPEMMGKTGGDEWLVYGGHRLWHAPEISPRTYWPDNVPVPYSLEGGVLRLSQREEVANGVAKDITLKLHPEKPWVSVKHRIMNNNAWPISLAPWTLSVMAPGGHLIVPQEPHRDHPTHYSVAGPEDFFPVRRVVLWPYTDMSDPRIRWGKKYITVRQDASPTVKKIKFGVENKEGWAAYALDGHLFVKKCVYYPGAEYPDLGSNMEFFTLPDMLEIELLGPVEMIDPGSYLEFTETWGLYRHDTELSDDAIDRRVLPKVSELPSPGAGF